MNKEKLNAAMRQAKAELDDALAAIRGMRKAYDKLYAAYRAVSESLVDLEGRWYLRLLRWVLQQPAPSDVVMKGEK